MHTEKNRALSLPPSKVYGTTGITVEDICDIYMSKIQSF